MVDPDVQSRSALGLLTLLSVPGIGRQTAQRLATKYAALGAIASATEADLRSMLTPRGLASFFLKETWEKAFSEAQQQLDRACALNVRIIPRFSPDFPEPLARIADPPLLLYVKGTLPTRHLVAGVGTRSPSVFGSTVATRLTRFLVEKGWGIVSGLAIGIDTHCHQTTLENHGYTVAVLANGLDSVYPSSNKKLAEDILASGGAIMSEQPFGARAFAQNLIQRDRLQSGLSLATFAMQTDVRGGTMHTVRSTLLQRRLLFAPVPSGSYRLEPKNQGILALVEQTGLQLSSTLAADPEYASLLRTEFANRPPAYGLKGTQDYASMLGLLTAAATSPVPEQPRHSQGRLFG